MQIIPASVQDENGIKTLLEAYGLPSDDISSSHLGNFFVIRDSDQIVGSIGLEVCGEFGLLRSLALSESLRGRGMGIQLVEHIEEYARSQKISSIYLLTTSADQFFTRLGYQTIARKNAPEPLQKTAEFRSICPASAVCMFKELQ